MTSASSSGSTTDVPLTAEGAESMSSDFILSPSDDPFLVGHMYGTAMFGGDPLKPPTRPFKWDLLPARLSQFVRERGLANTDQLAQVTFWDLQAQRGLGEVTLMELKDFLLSQGYTPETSWYLATYRKSRFKTAEEG